MKNLRESLFFEIVSYLTVKEIMTLVMVSKEISNTLQSNMNQLTRVVCHQFPGFIECRLNEKSFSQLRETLMCVYASEHSNLIMRGYYTDGKIIWSNDERFGIQSLFSRRSFAYGSGYTFIENILLKGVYSPYLSELSLGAPNSKENYISANEIFLKHHYDAILEAKSQSHYEAVIKTVKISRTSNIYMCPCYRLMGFLSTKDCGSPDIIKSFHSCKTTLEVEEAAKSNNVSYDIYDNGTMKYTVFGRSYTEVQPLFWADLHGLSPDGTIEIELKEGFVGSHIYILLIDCYVKENGPANTNLDMAPVFFSGGHVTIA